MLCKINYLLNFCILWNVNIFVNFKVIKKKKKLSISVCVCKRFNKVDFKIFLYLLYFLVKIFDNKLIIKYVNDVLYNFFIMYFFE